MTPEHKKRVHIVKVCSMIKILSVFGTRPEAIKMAPLVRELNRRGDGVISRVCVTAQHRDMLDQVLGLFNITPHYDLDLMAHAQTPTQVASSVLSRLEPILVREAPDWVLVQGDTTTVMAAAVAAFYAGVKVGHVEAGLRTCKKREPFPEEANRRMTSVVADLHFAPTATSADNLMREGISRSAILITGNTVIDALNEVAGMPYAIDDGELAGIPWQQRIVLVTAHRRENFGMPMEEICWALRDLVKERKDVHIVYPVHPNPNVREPVFRILSGTPGISLLQPLDYLPLVQLMKRATLILTDSGGIQEEAPSLGKPTLVLRNVTERPEAIEAGTVRLVGTDRATIVAEATRLLSDDDAYLQMSQAVNPYGDGHAAERIANALLGKPVSQFQVRRKVAAVGL
jgi:UDP-N-acetylglucosamine 2-epimerase (non-hydrolysing)